MPRLTRKMRGGELSAEVKRKIKEGYSFPTKMISEVGGLVDTEEDFFAQLDKIGLSYPKKALPKINQKYIDPEMFIEETIEDDTTLKTYSGLYPFKSSLGELKDSNWVYTCGVCPDDDDTCELSNAIAAINSLKPLGGVDITSLASKIRLGCRKTPDFSEINSNIVSAVRENEDFFVKYLYFLPWAVESNDVFYEKSVDLGIKLGFLTEAEKSVLKDSLSWNLLGCQPCMMYQNRIKKFCIDPFYLNESIEWVSNIYNEPDWSSSEGIVLFNKRAAPLVEGFKKQYGIDLSGNPAWWDPEFNKYKTNINAVIIIYEQNANRVAFQKIQFFMTIVKLLLTNYVILQPAGTNVVERAPLLNEYLVTAEATKYGCAASIAREIESKMHKLLELFNNSGFEECLAVYKMLDPFANGKLKNAYLSRYNAFIVGFLSLIGKEAGIVTIIKDIFDENLTSYQKMGEPLYLKKDEAEELGVCSVKSGLLIEELSALIISQNNVPKSAGKRTFRRSKKVRRSIKKRF